MKKRIVSFLLAIVLVVTLIPSFMIAASAKFSLSDVKNIFGVKTTNVGETVKESLSTFAGILKDMIPGLLHDYIPVNVYDVKFYVEKDKKAGLEGDIVVKINKSTNTGTIYLPGSADVDSLALSWDENVDVSLNGEKVKSGKAKIPTPGNSLVYSIDNGKKVVDVEIKTLQGSKGVSAMFLKLDESLGTISAMNADENHETKCYGSVAFEGEKYDYMSMKGRGNSTWDLAKKPYNITFHKKDDYDKKKAVELIDGIESKQWSLLANFMDNSLLRNKITLDLSNSLGIGLDSKYVDLYMNGEYLGNYLVTPKSDFEKPDGGFVLENDNWLEPEDGDYQFKLNGMYELGAAVAINDVLAGYYNRMTIKAIGDDAADAGVDEAYIETYVNEAFAALLDYNSEDYQKYFDLDSWSKMYLMHELEKNYDVFAGSILMHRDGLTENDKLIAGPVWDMDLILGRTMYKFFYGVSLPDQMTAEGWYIDGISLLGSNGRPCALLQELGKHKSFRDNVAKIYNAYKASFEASVSNISYQANLIEASANMDADVWGLHHLGVYFYFADLGLGTGKYQLHYKMTNTWRDYVDNMLEYATKRVMWLSDNLVPGAETIGSSKAYQAGQMISNIVSSVMENQAASSEETTTANEVVTTEPTTTEPTTTEPTTTEPIIEEPTTNNVTETNSNSTSKNVSVVSTIFGILGKLFTK